MISFSKSNFVFQYISLGQATLLAVVILSIAQLELLDVAHALEWVFLILFPNYCLGQGLNDIYQNFMVLPICKEVSALCILGPNPCCKSKFRKVIINFISEFLSFFCR
jgi:hypothetical protein